MTKKTQLQLIKEILETTKGIKGGITSLEAFREFGITRLSAIIHTLRHLHNMDIVSIMETTKNRCGDKVSFKRYLLLDRLSAKDLEKHNILDMKKDN